MANEYDQLNPDSSSRNWFDQGNNFSNPYWNANTRPMYGSPGGEASPWTQDSMRNPWGGNPGWGEDQTEWANHNAYITTNKPIDLGANFAQQWATPIASFMLAKRALAATQRPAFPMRGHWRNVWNTFGSTAPEWNAWARTGHAMGYGMGKTMGGVVGAGLESTIGLSSATAMGGTMARAGGFLGAGMGMAGSFFLAPEVLAAQALSSTVDKFVFEPYINRRRIEESALSNYSGMAISGSAGAHYGTGLSAQGAYALGKRVVDRGWNEMGFSNSAVAQIAGTGMANGLFAGIGDMSPDKVDKRLGSILESTKSTMRVLKMSEDKLQEIQAIIKQFSDQGISIGDSRFMNTLGAAAASTGFSAASILNNDASRFGGIAASMGMMPGSGMMAGVGAMGALGGLYNAGGISNPWLAQLGGLSGMAAASVSGAARGYGSPLGTMSLYNEYLGGRTGSGMVGTIGAFAMNSASDPLKAMADIYSKGDMMRSVAMQDKGVMGGYQSVIQMAQMLSGGGKATETNLALAAQMYGMSSNEYNAMYGNIQGAQRGSSRAGIRKTLEQALEADANEKSNAYLGVAGVFKRMSARYDGALPAAAAVAGWTTAGTAVGAGLGVAAAGALTVVTGGFAAPLSPWIVGGSTAMGAAVGAFASGESNGIAASLSDKFSDWSHDFAYGAHDSFAKGLPQEQDKFTKKLSGDIMGLGDKSSLTRNVLTAKLAQLAMVASTGTNVSKSVKDLLASNPNLTQADIETALSGITRTLALSPEETRRISRGGKRSLEGMTKLLGGVPHSYNAKDPVNSIVRVLNDQAHLAARREEYSGDSRLQKFTYSGAGGMLNAFNSWSPDVQNTGAYEAALTKSVARDTTAGLQETLRLQQAAIQADLPNRRLAANVEDLQGALANPNSASPEQTLGLAAQVFAAAVNKVIGSPGASPGETPLGVLQQKISKDANAVSNYAVH